MAEAESFVGFVLAGANWTPGHEYLPSGARFKAIHGSLGRGLPVHSRPQKVGTHIPSHRGGNTDKCGFVLEVRRANLFSF